MRLLFYAAVAFIIFNLCTVAYTQVVSCTITNTAKMPRAHARRLIRALNDQMCEPKTLPRAFPASAFNEAIEAAKDGSAEICILYEERQRMGFFERISLTAVKLRCAYHNLPHGSYTTFKNLFGPQETKTIE